jgi:hypothetical protein
VINEPIFTWQIIKQGYDENAAEGKLREVLDYVKEKVDAQKLKILKSVDTVAYFFKVNKIDLIPIKE